MAMRDARGSDGGVREELAAEVISMDDRLMRYLERIARLETECAATTMKELPNQTSALMHREDPWSQRHI
jgi:hypothetical protein